MSRRSQLRTYPGALKLSPSPSSNNKRFLAGHRHSADVVAGIRKMPCSLTPRERGGSCHGHERKGNSTQNWPEVNAFNRDTARMYFLR